MAQGKTQVETFRFTSNDPGLVAANGVANSWSVMWKYQVQKGNTLILRDGDPFSLRLQDAAVAEPGSYTCLVKVEKQDSSGGNAKLLFGPDMYIASRELTDPNLLARLSIPEGELRMTESQLLVISVLDDAVDVVASSYFQMLINKIRPSLQG
jgi:hypothetical protein